MNPKSSVGSIYNKSSRSGSAASSFAAPSDTAEGVTSGSKSITLDPLQQALIETFSIPANLRLHEKVADIRVTYAKYLDIQRVIAGVGVMERSATWTHKKPTVQEIAEIYMSRSGYFNRPHKFFPKLSVTPGVIVIPGMLEWLEGKEDAPTQEALWGDKKPSFAALSDMFDLLEGKKKKKVTKKKGKKQVELSSHSESHSEEEVVKGKGKGKAKAKKAKGGSKKTSSPSKSRQDDD
jgi:hypothetical protein